MFDHQRILVPIDFSDCSRTALGQAVELSRRSGAQIRVVHAYDPPYFGDQALINLPGQAPIALSDFARDDISRQLDVFLEPFRTDPAVAVRLATHVIPGVPFDEIPAEAARWAAELIVMGTHGRRGFKHWILGSVAERTIQRAACPVLVVRASEDNQRAPGEFRRILVPIAFDHDDAHVARLALAVAARTDGPVTFLHVVPIADYTMDVFVPGGEGLRLPEFLTEDAQKRLAVFASELGSDRIPAPLALVRHGSPSNQIVSVAEETSADLIVLGTRGRTGLAHLLIGSVAQQVLRGAHCAVMVTKGPANAE